MKNSVVFLSCLLLVVGFQNALSVITISNVQKSFDAMACEVTITWDTSVCTDTNLIKWATTPCSQDTFPNTATEEDSCSTSHSVTFSVVGSGRKIAFIIESSDSTDSGSTSCAPATSGPCF